MLKSQVKLPEYNINKPIKSNVEKIELAKAYAALSNAHHLILVDQMFAENAVYDSTGVGLFEGREAIASMMDGFFSQYPDVHWNTRNFTHGSDDIVLFDFEMSATHIETGQILHRKGVEKMIFTESGLISRLEVTAA